MKAYKEIIEGRLRAYPPVKRSIYYCDNLYTLQFPTMLFFFIDEHLYVHGAFGPIRSLNDLIFEIPINNMYEYGSICGCDAMNLSKAINLFWNSAFNTDGRGRLITDIFAPDSDYFSSGYRKWQELSEEGSALEFLFNRMKDRQRKKLARSRTTKEQEHVRVIIPLWRFLNTAIADKQHRSGRLCGIPMQFYGRPAQRRHSPHGHYQEAAILSLKKCFNFNFPTRPCFPVQGL